MEHNHCDTPCQFAFDTEKYKLDRAHELELNKFTHVLEVERMKLLTYLNGGAAAAWLTFSKASPSSDDALAAAALVIPPLIWLVGLLLASVATQATFKTQRSFTQAYHRRRRADEWRILRRSYGDVELSRILPRLPGTADLAEEIEFGRSADEFADTGQRAAVWVMAWTFASVGAFVLGALAAGVLTWVTQMAVSASIAGG